MDANIAIIKIKYYLQFCVTFFALKTFLLNFSWQGILVYQSDRNKSLKKRKEKKKTVHPNMTKS